MTLEWVGWEVVALRGWGSDHTGIMYAVGVVCILWAQTVQGSCGVGRQSPCVRRRITSCTYIRIW